MVAYADPKLQNHYLSAIDKIEKGGSVSLEEFKAFKEFISDDLESLEHEIKDKGMLNKKYFKSMWQKLEADNQFKMSSLQYSIIFQILDADGDGRVSHKEFTSLLKDSQNLGRHIEADVKSLLRRRQATRLPPSKTSRRSSGSGLINAKELLK